MERWRARRPSVGRARNDGRTDGDDDRRNDIMPAADDAGASGIARGRRSGDSAARGWYRRRAERHRRRRRRAPPPSAGAETAITCRPPASRPSHAHTPRRSLPAGRQRIGSRTEDSTGAYRRRRRDARKPHRLHGLAPSVRVVHFASASFRYAPSFLFFFISRPPPPHLPPQ